MDNSTSTPHTVLEYIPYIVSTFIALSGSALGYLFGRKQSVASIRKTEAETRAIDATTMVTLIKEAGVQAVRAERVANERDHWRQKAEVWEARALLLEREMDERIRVNPALPPFEAD